MIWSLTWKCSRKLGQRTATTCKVGPLLRLADLVDSADLHVRLQATDPNNRARDALTALGATAFKVTISGIAEAGDVVPSDLTPLEAKLVQPPEVVLTTPVCDGRELAAFPVTISRYASLAKSEDKVVWLSKDLIPQCYRGCGGAIVNDSLACTPDPRAN